MDGVKDNLILILFFLHGLQMGWPFVLTLLRRSFTSTAKSCKFGWRNRLFLSRLLNESFFEACRHSQSMFCSAQM